MYHKSCTRLLFKSVILRKYNVFARSTGLTQRAYLHVNQKKPFVSRLPIKSASTLATLTVAAYFYMHKYDRYKPESCQYEPVCKHSASSTVKQLLNGNDRTSVRTKSTNELILTLIVFKVCAIPWLVDAGCYAVRLAEWLHFQTPIYWLIRKTFFKQFCGGEKKEECSKVVLQLSQFGINCILDLCLEDDIDDFVGSKKECEQQERRAEAILKQIKTSIIAAAEYQEIIDCIGNIFLAVKVTALAPPQLLLALNEVLVQLEQEFENHQVEGSVDSIHLTSIINRVCPKVGNVQYRKRTKLVAQIQKTFSSLDFNQFLDIFHLASSNRKVLWETDDPMVTENDVVLTMESLRAYDNLIKRLNEVCLLAKRLGVGIMVDAEQSYFQEAISYIAMDLKEQYNQISAASHSPTVFNTYQMYMKKSQKRLERDIERAERQNFIFAAKLVRGAYMHSERERAHKMGYPSPIFNTIEETHQSYNNSIYYLLLRIQKHQLQKEKPITASPVVFMVATHNKESIILTLKEIERLNITSKTRSVHFGQLYGMQDQVSYILGKNGYSVYKYLPYGIIHNVIPYLMRRAQENSDVFGRMESEMLVIWQEVKDRLFFGQ